MAKVLDHVAEGCFWRCFVLLSLLGGRGGIGLELRLVVLHCVVNGRKGGEQRCWL